MELFHKHPCDARTNENPQQLGDAIHLSPRQDNFELPSCSPLYYLLFRAARGSWSDAGTSRTGREANFDSSSTLMR